MKHVFKTLVLREIQGAIVDFRFWVVLVLCLSIIPLSFYVSVKDYSQRLSDYHQAVQTYRDMTPVHVNTRAEGVHPPSPLSIFSRGLDNKMPYKVITARDRDYVIEYAKPDVRNDLLGEIDFGFIVSFVLSILAIVFTFNCISGDKEQGLLRAMLSNVVYRRQILMAKLTGNYLVFLAPFLISMMIALLVVQSSGLISVFSAEILPSILMMTAVSLIFIFALFNLGIWISAMTANSTLSINVLLLIWIVLGLVVPKISPIISASIYPVESNSVFEIKKIFLWESINKEQRTEEEDLTEKLRAQYNPGTHGMNSEWTELTNAYDELVVPIREKYEQRYATEIARLTDDYEMRRNRRNNLTASITRLSPIGIVNNLMAEFSETGHSEAANFLQQARQYQQKVKEEIYDNFILKVYYGKGGSMMSNANRIEGFDSSGVAVPTLDNYKRLGIGEILRQNMTDILLLCIYGLLFFVCAFVSFLRFDVR
ncbi:MAG: ABC transporter permease [Tannerellaceae bacterium]|nr:ABC transporter permease [Tannerellaceae bacterium]